MYTTAYSSTLARNSGGTYPADRMLLHKKPTTTYANHMMLAPHELPLYSKLSITHNLHMSACPTQTWTGNTDMDW